MPTGPGVPLEATLTTETSLGVPLSSLTGDDELPIADGSETFERFLEACTFAYQRPDFQEQNSGDYIRARMVYDEARRRGWRCDEFDDRVRAFVTTMKFPTWTPAEFFAVERAQVYHYQWYCERIGEAKSNNELIGAYRIAGMERPMYGWRRDCDGHLEPFHPEDRRALPEHQAKAGIPADVQPEWNATKRLLEVEGQIDELTQQRNRAYRETEMHRQLLEATQAELREAHATILHLESEIARMKQSHVTAAVAP